MVVKINCMICGGSYIDDGRVKIKIFVGYL